jgi:hypothetical protein
MLATNAHEARETEIPSSLISLCRKDIDSYILSVLTDAFIVSSRHLTSRRILLRDANASSNP